jgi:hypothetical protein
MLVIETPKMPLTGCGPADAVTTGVGDRDGCAGEVAAGVETRPVFALGDAVRRGLEAELGAELTLGARAALGAELTLGARVTLGACSTLRAEDE